jgi:alanyl-tRNA synthetase
MVAFVAPDLVKRGVQANKLIKEVAVRVGGSGGGRPEMGQAGGRDPARLPEALALVFDAVGRINPAGKMTS